MVSVNSMILKPPRMAASIARAVTTRSGSPAFGTPENALANIAGGQLARRYKLPYRSSACNASNAVDAQAIYETQMALWGADLTGEQIEMLYNGEATPLTIPEPASMVLLALGGLLLRKRKA